MGAETPAQAAQAVPARATEAPPNPNTGPDDRAVVTDLERFAGRRVAVALSGGVDSAVAAWRLRQAGAEVIGLSLRLHDPDPDHPMAPRACCPPDDLQDARRVAEQLGFPFYVVDGRGDFDRTVVRPFVKAYVAGRTPNPCVGCNSGVKLSRLIRRARALGCEGLATGHYARIVRSASGETGRLYRGVDAKKDQSYFLARVGPADLGFLLFPLGAWDKAAVKSAALDEGLPVAHKLESQEVCFVGGKGAGAFVRRQPEARAVHGGEVVTRDGAVVGRHDGVLHFTVGQRRGLGIAAPEPLYVLGLDALAKQVVVGGYDELACGKLVARAAHWTGPSDPTRRYCVAIRYRDRGTEAQVAAVGDELVVRFTRPVHAVAPGQLAVVYDGEEVVGSGWIERGEA